MDTVFTHRFTVEGRARFPLDMLRFDMCHPRTSTDVAAMETAERPGSDVQTVTLIHTSDDRFWRPTVGRWSSFGWSVTPNMTTATNTGRDTIRPTR